MGSDDSNRTSGKQSLFLLLGLLVFGILSWILWRGSWREEENYDVKRAAQRAEKLKVLKEEDAKKLTSYAWVDKEAGVASIPIKEAMNLALERLQKKSIRSGSVIAAAVSGGATNVVGTNSVTPDNMGTNAGTMMMTNMPSTNGMDTNGSGTNSMSEEVNKP
ncbi:MAG: hypothetical protein K1X66_00265 [Verrucomicrobiae bacterium]|nr:hypothetical protein [Verrucomicrobiae bacterium]